MVGNQTRNNCDKTLITIVKYFTTKTKKKGFKFYYAQV